MIIKAPPHISHTASELDDVINCQDIAKASYINLETSGALLFSETLIDRICLQTQAWHEAVFTAAIDDEGGQSLEVTADWLLLDGEFTPIGTGQVRAHAAKTVPSIPNDSTITRGTIGSRIKHLTPTEGSMSFQSTSGQRLRNIL